jgi:hypothetical protein
MHERERTHATGPCSAGGGKLSPGHRREFTQAERRAIFKQMVVAELEGGVLRYSRRRALQRYAEEIGIPAFDTNLLIAEAQHRAKQLEPIEFVRTAEFPGGPERSGPRPWPSAHRLTIVLIAAAMIDLLLIAWLIY